MRKMSISKMIATWGTPLSIEEAQRRLRQTDQVVYSVWRKKQFYLTPVEIQWTRELKNIDWKSSYWEDDKLIAYTTKGSRVTIDKVFVQSDVRQVSRVVRHLIDELKLEEARKEVDKWTQQAQKLSREVDDAQRLLETAQRRAEKAVKVAANALEKHKLTKPKISKKRLKQLEVTK